MADPTVVMNFEKDPNIGIHKKVLHAGRGDVPDFVNGTKVKFHYITRKTDEDHTVLEDSRKGKKPAEMELYIGKKFKLEVWETCIKSMRPNEVASFTVEPYLLGSYPIVAKSLRTMREDRPLEHQQHHCCGMMMKEEKSLGYPDLDEYVKNPTALEFIIELTHVDQTGEYEKDSWAMDENEQISAVPKLKDEGNKLFAQKNYSEAAEKYAKALGLLENLLLKEKPHDEEWNKLDDMKVPFLLNYSQCKLYEEEFYQVIEHTSEVLKRHPDNVKALFRRAKGYVGAWDPEEAKKDFAKVLKLDNSLEKAVKKELKNISDLEKAQAAEDKVKLQGKLFT